MKSGPPGGRKENFYEGEEERHVAARQAFPILIELATDKTHPTIFYGQLADRIGMEYIPKGLRSSSLKGRRAQWMSYPLGHIWQTLFEYQQESNIETLKCIPYLTTIVVSQDTPHLPTIFRTYLHWSDEKIRSEQEKVYRFEHWREILEGIRMQGGGE